MTDLLNALRIMIIENRIVGTIYNSDVIEYRLENSRGFSVSILNYGGIITKIMAPNIAGNHENVVLSYENLLSYEKNPSYLGAVIGRTSGRICGGRVELDGKTIEFNSNYGLHQGHGGSRGFSKRFWECEGFIKMDDAVLRLSYMSPNGEEGYPGNLTVNVDYRVTEDNELIIYYQGKSDEKTLINMTNHSYFNLSGNVKDNILNHSLYIDGDYIAALDKTKVPKGTLMDVANTPFDFKTPRRIDEGIDDNHEQIQIASGYDHPWILNKGPEYNVKLSDPESGRVLEVFTDQIAAVIYTMNFPDDEMLSIGKRALKRDGICIETQSPPIGLKNSFLEYSILDVDNVYKKWTRYKFSVEK